jgi:hypothetical protein
MADETKPSASKIQSERYEESPAKVAGDRDEAKELPDDIAVNVSTAPDADLHHPAAADSIADAEAGVSDSGGRIEPLTRRLPRSSKA